MLPGRNQMWLLFLMLMLVLTPINGLLRVRARKRNNERSTGAVILASVWTALLVVLNLYLIASNGPAPIYLAFLALSAFWLGASVQANRTATPGSDSQAQR